MNDLLALLESVAAVDVTPDMLTFALVRKGGRAKVIARRDGARVFESKGGNFRSLAEECVAACGGGASVPVVDCDDGYVEFALVGGEFRMVIPENEKRLVFMQSGGSDD